MRDVANGSALHREPPRLYEVYAGDPVPGLGRVDCSIRKPDLGRWVVVTSKGLIVARRTDDMRTEARLHGDVRRLFS